MRDSVARHVVTRVPVLGVDATVGDALASLPGRRDSVDSLYVVDADGRLRGRARLHDVLAHTPETPLSSVLHPAHAVAGDDPPDRVVQRALRDAVAEVPVVGPDGRFVGVVPAGALLHMLRREHVEDLHRLAGITREEAQVREAADAPPTRRARHRLPWLFVGLVGSVASAAVMASFEGELQRNVAVAYFVPGIVYLADAIGTQTETIAVRALSLSHAPLPRMLAGELRTGVLVGAVLAGLLAPIVWLGWGDGRLALAVSIAVLVAGALATSIGLLLPWVLHATGRDPAFGSGPLATIIQDVLSLLVYFAAVHLLLR
jgi:magnesium transporter